MKRAQFRGLHFRGSTVARLTDQLCAEDHWKFIIAHEMGHQVPYKAMGDLSNDYDDAPSELACQCTFDPVYALPTVARISGRRAA